MFIGRALVGNDGRDLALLESWNFGVYRWLWVGYALFCEACFIELLLIFSLRILVSLHMLALDYL